MDHFEWRALVRGVWTQWVLTEEIGGSVAGSPGDEIGWRFEVRAVDNEGAVDPTPAWFEWIWE